MTVKKPFFCKNWEFEKKKEIIVRKNCSKKL